MDTSDTPQKIKPAALPADDPRLSEEAIAFRRANRIAERDDYGRLLPGSQLQNKGRKPGPMLVTLARAHTENAVRVLGEIVNDPKAPQAARVAAANGLLDRGWGKAPIQVDMQVKSRFDDFLREVGLAATYEMEQEIAGVTLGHFCVSGKTQSPIVIVPVQFAPLDAIS